MLQTFSASFDGPQALRTGESPTRPYWAPQTPAAEEDVYI